MTNEKPADGLGKLEIKGFGQLVIPDDVTALEAAHLAELLAKLATATRGRDRMAIDIPLAIANHKLQRFFQPKDS